MGSPRSGGQSFQLSHLLQNCVTTFEYFTWPWLNMVAGQLTKEDQGCWKFHFDKTASIRLRLTCTQLCVNFKLIHNSASI